MKSTIDVDFPGATSTFAQGINADDEIVGSYFDSTGATRSYVFAYGHFIPVDVPFPGAHGTSAEGINDRGEIVGPTLVKIPRFMASFSTAVLSRSTLLCRG